MRMAMVRQEGRLRAGAWRNSPEVPISLSTLIFSLSSPPPAPALDLFSSLVPENLELQDVLSSGPRN